MHLFHVPDLENDLVELPPTEAHHAIHVLRLDMGERVGLIDGRGGMADAELATVSKKKCQAKVLSFRRTAPERSARIHLAVAPTKQMERFEWFLEKAVEVGVDRITPLLTDRSERSQLRHDRAMKVMIAAMKQSQRKWLPTLDPMTRLAELIKEDLPAQRYFGWCDGDHPSLMGIYDPHADALVLIGPEGDLSNEEASVLTSNGSIAVKIGASRLRTETAALAACTWMSLAQQR